MPPTLGFPYPIKMTMDHQRGRHMAPRHMAPSGQGSPFVTIRGRPGDSSAGGNSFSSADSAYGSQAGGPSSSPPRNATHNISRAKYHMDDIGEFARNLEVSASRAFPNTLRNSRYTKVQALLLHWESDDLFVLPEVQDLGKCFDEVYHFGIEYFTIPADNSHLELMMKIAIFLKQFESPDTLLIVYYGGHARIDESRQSTWCATRERDSPWLQWSAIQTLLERSPSDVLILLDCCAGAASATFPNGQSVTETISASSWDAIAPDPGRYSFTSALIEVLLDWENRAFSAAMIHAEVLARLKHPRPEMRNGRHYEARSTPVHFMMTANHRKPSIEVCKAKEIEAVPALSSTVPSLTTPGGSSGTMTPSAVPPTAIPAPADHTDARLQQRAPDAPPDLDSDPSTEVALFEPEPSVETPHVMISLALERNQRLDLNAWEQWLNQFPALAKYVKVQGVFESHSSLLLLSLPVSVWSMLPENDACNFVAFIRSNNLIASPDHAGPEHVNQDGASCYTSFTGSTMVMSAAQTQVGPQPQQQQQSMPPEVNPTPRLNRSRSLVLPGPEVQDPSIPAPAPGPSRSGTTAGILNRTLKRAANMGSTLSLQQSARATMNATLRQSPSASSLKSLRPPLRPHPVSSGASMAYQPIMTHARATRRTNFHGQDIPERPNFSDHVELFLENFYSTKSRLPSDGIKETIASNIGVEFKDVALWFHHRRSEDKITRRFEKMKIEDGSPTETSPTFDSSFTPSGIPPPLRMILPGHLSELLSFLPASQLLIIDVRNSGGYQKSHIYSALNLRMPVRFINVATQDMMSNALRDGEEKKAFEKWRTAKCVIFYDRNVEYAWEVPQAEALARWWRRQDPSWAGRTFILKGPYMEVQLNQDKYIVGAKMSDEAREWVKSVEEQPEHLGHPDIAAQYEGWLGHLDDEDHVPQASLVPSKEEERIGQLEDNQRAMEKEFCIQKPKMWETALSLQVTEELPMPDVLPRSYSESMATGKGKVAANEEMQAVFVEPLVRGLEKVRGDTGGGGELPRQRQQSGRSQQIGGKLFPASSPSVHAHGKMVQQESSAPDPPELAKKPKAPLGDDKEYDMVDEEDEELFKPQKSGTLGAASGRVRGLKGKWFGR